MRLVLDGSDVLGPPGSLRQCWGDLQNQLRCWKVAGYPLHIQVTRFDTKVWGMNKSFINEILSSLGR